jgi:hypothetical protein
MDEYEIKYQYNSLKSYIEKIEHIKKSLTPKQYLELQSLLVNSLNHEQSFKTAILKRLDKKLDEIREGPNDEFKQLDTKHKIMRRKSIKNLRLKPKNFKGRITSKLFKRVNGRKSMKNLSPIMEETSVHSSKSAGGRRRKLRKTMRFNRST